MRSRSRFESGLPGPCLGAAAAGFLAAAGLAAADFACSSSAFSSCSVESGTARASRVFACGVFTGVGPEAFTEVRYLAHHRQMQALDLIPQVAAEFAEVFGRDAGGLLSTYRADDADLLVVSGGALSVFDARTGAVVVDEVEEEGITSGSFDLGFDDGTLSGSFEMEYCNNLKTKN